jgi:hypothetical protein
MSRPTHISYRGPEARSLAIALLVAIATGLGWTPARATVMPPDPNRGISSEALVATSLGLGAAGITVGLMPPSSASSRTLRGASSLALGAVGLVVLSANLSSHNGTHNDVLPYLAALSDFSAAMLGLSMRHRELRPHDVSGALVPYPAGGLGVALRVRF